MPAFCANSGDHTSIVIACDKREAFAQGSQRVAITMEANIASARTFLKRRCAMLSGQIQQHASDQPSSWRTAMPDEISPVSSLRDGYLRSVLDWQAAFNETLMQAQRSQFQILSACQNALGAVNQDLWDRWRCRFGGGVPLDG